MKSKSNTQMIPVVGFLSIFLIVGLVLIFFGVKDSFSQSRETKGYRETTGYLSDYTLKKESEYDPVRKRTSAATYALEYRYTVDGREYTVFTDYSTSILPELGSSRDIRYDPDNPEKAVLTGPNKNFSMVFLGILFSLGAILFLWIMLAPVKRKKKKQPVLQPALLLFGLIFVLFGYGALYMITGEVSPVGIIAYYRTSFVFPLLIPPLLIVAGVWVCVNSFRPSKAVRDRKSSDPDRAEAKESPEDN